MSRESRTREGYTIRRGNESRGRWWWLLLSPDGAPVEAAGQCRSHREAMDEAHRAIRRHLAKKRAA